MGLLVAALARAVTRAFPSERGCRGSSGWWQRRASGLAGRTGPGGAARCAPGVLCLPYACCHPGSACSVNMCHGSERGPTLNLATLRLGVPGEAWGVRAPAGFGAGGCLRRREGRVWWRRSGRAGAGRAGDSWAPAMRRSGAVRCARRSGLRAGLPSPSESGQEVTRESQPRAISLVNDGHAPRVQP